MDRFLSRRIRVVFQAIVPAFRTPRFARYWTLRPVAAVALVAVFAAVSGARVAVAQDEQSDDEMVVVHTASGIDASADTVYYNLNTGELAAKDEPWDLAFKGTTILVNGEAKIVDKAFEKVREAGSDGFAADKPGDPAIPTGNDEGWFDYDPNSHVVTPVPFRTIVLKLASGGFAKMEVVDYYSPDGTPREYTFRYALSGSGAF
ncbi:MAG: HmuY family protein [Rhodothermales bacterium]